MPQRLNEPTLTRLSGFLAREMGLMFPRERWSDLERGMIPAAKAFGFAAVEECIAWLLSAHLTRRQIEILAAFLTIGETYFFRDPRVFEVLEQQILPELLRARRGGDQRLRLWSAGCASGEEAYSIAIVLHRLVRDLDQWNLFILATDINAAALAKGRGGVYGDWSFRNAPAWLKEHYFTREGEGHYQVIAPVRRMVSFEYLNLAEDSYPSLYSNSNAMDVIMCRNVLMYFAPEMAHMVVDKLNRALVQGGWLIVSPTEHARIAAEPLEPVSFDGAILYRKEAPPYQPPEVAPPLPEAEAVQTTPVTAKSLECAETMYGKGEYHEAAALLSALYDGAVIPVGPMTLLIRCHANRGELDAALELCDATLEREKMDPALHFLRAEILQEKGRSEEALDSLNRALYLDPELVLAHFVLGNLCIWSGRPEKARKHFRNALLERYQPDDILPDSEGMTAARVREIIRSTMPDASPSSTG